MFDSLDLILPDEAHDGPMQMALDEVLLGAVVRPTLRIYRWSSPCVTFGYFQAFAAVRDAYPALPLVRRWTGGGMVEHGKDLTFSLMVPKGTEAALMPPTSFYRELHRRLASWLARVVPTEVRLAGREDIQSGPACFSSPAGDDLLLSGQKILGGAQRRSAGALLYQGSLQRLEGLPLDCVAMARSLSSRVDQQVIGRALKEEANLLAERRYRSNEWVSRR
jgi:lipoate-protein ligase A